MGRKKLITNMDEIVLSYAKSIYPKEFESGDIGDKYAKDELCHVSSGTISNSITRLINKGEIVCTTPDKARYRTFRYNPPQDTASVEKIPDTDTDEVEVHGILSSLTQLYRTTEGEQKELVVHILEGIRNICSHSISCIDSILGDTLTEEVQSIDVLIGKTVLLKNAEMTQSGALIAYDDGNGNIHTALSKSKRFNETMNTLVSGRCYDFSIEGAGLRMTIKEKDGEVYAVI